jgi:hypothetical protein
MLSAKRTPPAGIATGTGTEDFIPAFDCPE